MRRGCSHWPTVTWRIIYESDKQSSKERGPEAQRVRRKRAFREHSRSPWKTMRADCWGKPVGISQPEENPLEPGGRNFANPIV